MSQGAALDPLGAAPPDPRHGRAGRSRFDRRRGGGTIADHLADNPSLRARLDDVIALAYRRAPAASLETGQREAVFPVDCPWTLAQMMAEDFWPDAT